MLAQAGRSDVDASGYAVLVDMILPPLAPCQVAQLQPDRESEQVSGLRANVAEIFPKAASITRIIGSVLFKQNFELNT